MNDSLFDEPARHIPEPVPKLTAGERLRRRQAASILAGRHPLSDPPGGPLRYGVLRLHPEASRVTVRELVPPGTPTCGGCRFRSPVHGGAKDYPKCTWGRSPTTSPSGYSYEKPGPRESHSERSDVRAWWPACIDHEPVAPP